MNRRTFLGLLAGSVLFPGVPEFQNRLKGYAIPIWKPHTVTVTYGDVASEEAGWVEVTPQDYDGRMWRHPETGKVFSVSETHGWSIAHDL